MEKNEKNLSVRLLALLLTICMLMQVCPPQLVRAAAAGSGTQVTAAPKEETEKTDPAETTVPAEETTEPSTEESTAAPDSTEESEEPSVPEDSVPQEVPATEEELNMLAALIAEAEAKHAEDYRDGWEAMQSALADAKEVLLKEAPSQEEFSSAFTMLRSSLDTMTPAQMQFFSMDAAVMSVEPGLTQVGNADALPAEIPAGSTVELTADIVLGQDQQITLIAGTLDGKGHTITLSGLPMAAEVTGTVQNLGVSGTVKCADDPAAPITRFLNGGSVLNSFSVADVSTTALFGNTTGLVGSVENGTIRNCYVAGTQKGMEKYGLTGGCNSEDKMSSFRNTYYNEGSKITSFGTAYNAVEVAKKTLDEMKTPEFAELLNAGIASTGYVWAAADGSLPVLTEAGSTDPQTPDSQPVNTAELEAAIQAGQAYQEQGNYTDISWNTLQSALTAATAALADKDLTQEQADTAASDLRTAIAALQENPSDDPLAELKTLVAEAEALKQEDYTSDSWGPFAMNLEMAKDCIQSGTSDPEPIGFAVEDLRNAMGALVPVDPQAQLKDLIAQAEKLQKKDYTPESWAALEGALMNARDVADRQVDADIYKANYQDLKTAMDGLKAAEPSVPGQVNTAKLQAAVAEAKAIQDEKTYTEQTWAALQVAIMEAEAALQKEGLTQEEADAQEQAVRNAISGLKKLPADTSKLQAAIDEAKALNEKDYTDGSWGNMYVAIMMAESDMKKPGVSQETIDGHEKAVRDAMAALKKKIVVTELQAAIDEAKALKEQDYTPESWKAMQEKLTAAEDEVVYQHSQEKVDAAAADLRQAIKDLKKPAAGVDTSRLKAVIDEAKALKEQDYTDSSWANLQIALMMAEPVLKNPQATQDQIDAQTTAVRSAIDALKAKIVVTELQAAIDEAKALKEQDYTPESWKAMQEKLTAAEDEVVYQHSQEKVDAAAAGLRQAIKDLKSAKAEVDKTGLNAVIKEAKGLLNQEMEYTEDSFAAMRAALVEAEGVVTKEGGATQEEVNAAEANLRKAIDGLQKVQQDPLADLKALVAQCKVLKAEDYTPETWEPFAFTLEDAERLIRENVQDAELIGITYQELTAAKGRLVKAEKEPGALDTSKLQKAIEDAKAITDEKTYTEQTWAALQVAIMEAEAALQKEGLTQEEADAQEQAVRNAIAGLKKLPADTSKLQAAIDEAKALNEKDYTDGSWGNLYVAIMMAEMDMKKPGVSQETIDGHEKAVRDAVAALKKKIVVTELQAAIDEAKALKQEDYTPESWKAMQEKLTAAEDEVVYQHSQEQVDAAAAGLRQAIKDLKPVEDPSQPEGNVIRVSTGDEMPDSIAPDVTVILTADITLNKQIKKIEGVLDGKGHTVTVNGKAMAQEVTGTVQNLGVLTTAPIQAAGVYPTNNGPIAINLNGGLIQACWSTAELKSFFDDLGGLVGVSVGGTIRNSYFAGSASGSGIGGLIGASQSTDRMSRITDSYYAGVDKPVSAGNAYNENDPTVGKKNLDFMKTSAFADLLNANMPNTGYHWEVAGGQLPTLVEGRPDGTPNANTEALSAVIREAGELVETKYTAESWQTMQDALTAAKAMLQNAEATQDQVNQAAADLRTAMENLQEKPVEIRTEAVALPDTGVIEITSQKQIQKMTAENTKGNYYRLANDIVIDDGYWIGTSFAGVLDGSGYTIHVLNKNPIFEYLTAEAVIQNTGFIGEVKGFGMDIGGVAVDSNGLIVNCWNRMTVSSEGSNGVRKDSGAFVAHLKKGGAIVNSYAAGKVFSKGDKGAGVPGALAATSEANTLVKNGMYLNTTANNPVGRAAGQVENCTRQKRGGFYSQENLAALNAGRGTYGKEWTIDNEGWFHLGAAGNFDPSVGSGMRFSFAPIYNRDPIDFSSGDGIELSMGDFLIPADTEGEMPRILGHFSNPNFDGQIALVPEYTAVGQGSHGVMTYDDGGLVVSYPGDLTVHVMDKASWSGTGYDKELTSFTIVVTPITAEDIRLIPHGKYVDPVKNTIMGSGNVTTEAQIMVNGEWKKGNPTSFGFSIEGKVFGEGDGFRPTAPGKIKIGCFGFGRSASLEMESLYVPVTLIRPYPYGVHWIHERDANSNKLGNFLDLNLADQAGRVYIEPENASYNGDGSWKMESSDPKIAEYIPDFLLAVLPYKAGKVTLTAISLDPNLKEPVTGTSEIELKYLNPVTAVEVNLEELDEAHRNPENGHMVLQGDEEISLPIHFTGTKAPELHEDPNDGIVKEFSWHVSEPEMIWFQEGDGEVEIVIDGNTGMWVKTPIENCVANDSFKIAGVTNGTVTVTGIPADKTNKVEPVTFTVEVTGVSAPEPYDVQGFINSAKPSAIAGVYSGIKYQCGSDEWQVLSLIRAGEQLPQDRLDSYYKSVMDTIPGWRDSRKPTDFERVALALSAMGKNITALTYTDKEGQKQTFNLAQRIYNHKYLSDGSNEVAFALLALDARNTEIPAGAKNTRDSMLELLLSFQNEDGGFGLAPGGSSGADTTSMSLQALAPYQNRPEVAAAIENGLVYLKNNVHTKAGHFDQGTVESNAQTIIAMAVLGRDLLTEPDFYSAKYNLMKAMEPYHVGGEGFKHTAVDPKINAMATSQALQALDAYERFLGGKTGYWDFTDQAQYPEIHPDGSAVAEALNLIHKLPDAADVAERDRKAIEAARAAYDALTPEQQALVNADRLIAAEEALKNLPAEPDGDQAAADAVSKLIEKLPAEIKLTDKEAVQAARAAYDKLTEAQKKLVTNLDKLTAAEEAIKKLEEGERPEPAAGKIYLTVERFTLGAGFIQEPVEVTFTKGQTYADMLDQVLGDRVSIRDNHNYLEMIRGANPGPEHVTIPQYITDMSKGRCTTEAVRSFYTERGFEAWPDDPGDLGEFSYSTQSGYMYSVNGSYPGTGIGETPVQDGAVVRFQYTVYGLGNDCKKGTNMDALIQVMAKADAAARKDTAVEKAYQDAVKVMADAVVPAEQVTAAADKLRQALENPGKPDPDPSGDFLTEARKDTAAKLQTEVTTAFGGENDWVIYTLLRRGDKIDQSILDAYYENVVKEVSTWNAGRKPTDIARIMLPLSVMGKDVTNVGGKNLPEMLYDHKYLTDGSNEFIWALIALDAKGTPIPENAKWTRKTMLEGVLSFQNPDGGFALTEGGRSDIDITGMALQAMAPYMQDPAVKAAADKAWKYLADSFKEKLDAGSVEAIAQTMLALSVNGKDLAKEAGFMLKDKTLLDSLKKYVTDGGFSHKQGSPYNLKATWQAMQAMDAYARLLNGEDSYWRLSGTIPADPAPTAEKVDQLIDEIGNVTLSSEKKIAEARKAYEALSEEQKKLVQKLPVLEAAEHKLEELKANLKEAGKVIEMIEKLPDAAKITSKDKEAVEAARKAFDGLTEDQKKLVTNEQKLKDAEKKLKEVSGGGSGGGDTPSGGGSNPGGGGSNPGGGGNKPANTKIKVKFELWGDKIHGRGGAVHTYHPKNTLSLWVPVKTVEVEKGAKVLDVFKLGVGKLPYVNKYDDNYISEINGLAEFTNGPKSGWMYMLNGKYPDLGVKEQVVQDGDHIIFHYTDDYTMEDGTYKPEDNKKPEEDNKKPEEDKMTPQKVIELIEAIGTPITKDSKAKIDAAREAYDSLSPEDKEKVTNYDKLLEAEKAYDALNADPADQEAAKKVEDLIKAIGTVTKDSEKKIQDARAAYDQLTEAQKKLVSNYDDLAAAEKKLAELKATPEDKEAAKKSEEKIDAIDPENPDPEMVKEARKAYDALTDIQKKLVSNYDKLLQAEKALKGTGREDLYKKVGDYLSGLAAKQAPVPGVIGGEWIVIGLARSGRSVPEAYYDNAVAYVEQAINDQQQLHEMKSTENSRMILALTAIGKDVTDVAGHNLLKGLTDLSYIRTQGINGPIWALIALDSNRYEIPENPKAKEPVTREKLVAEILDAQLPDGGWTLSGDKSDPDMTGMALQALAPYYEKEEGVKAAVDKALDCVSKMQKEDGTFGGKKSSSEASTQIIVALTALGIDPDKDSRFIKNGNSALDGLVKFAEGDGFAHLLGGEQDGMATEQGYYALTAYHRFLEGKTSLYDMSDVTFQHIHSYEWKFTELPGTKDGLAVGICGCGEKSEVQIPAIAAFNMSVEAAPDNWMGAKLTDNSVLQAITLTNAEFKSFMEGSKLKVTLEASTEVSEADAEVLSQHLTEDQAMQAMDITLWKQVEGNKDIMILNTEAPVSITLEIPEELQHKGRIFTMLAMHDGEVSQVPVQVDAEAQEMQFETDHFSVYAVVYEDTGMPGGMIIACTAAALSGAALVVAAIWFLLKKKARSADPML